MMELGGGGQASGRCADELQWLQVHMHSGFPARRSKQMIMMS